MYTANRLHRDLERDFSPEDILGVEMTPRKISSILNKVLSKYGGKVKFVREGDILEHEIAVSGMYDLDAKKNNPVIFLHFSTKTKKYKFTKPNYKKFLFIFSQVVQHEFIHKAQYAFNPERSDTKLKVQFSKKLSKHQRKEIEYLREWCEIDAYAHDIAMEIKKFYPKERETKVFNTIDKRPRLKSFVKYKRTFRGTEWGKVRKTLLKRVWKWLPKTQIPPLTNV